MNELATINPTTQIANYVQTLDLSHQLAQRLVCTTLVPKPYQGRPDDAAVAILWGSLIGVNPIESLQNIAVINGTPTIWGDLLVALVKSSGACEYLTTHYDSEKRIATVKTKRRGEPEEMRQFSWEDAKAAGFTAKETYNRHPMRMLSARARSHILRDVYADLLKGFQIREITEEDYQQIISRDVTPPTVSQTLAHLTATSEPEVNYSALIADAQDMEELESLREQIKKLPENEYKSKMRSEWINKQKEFKQ
jgi:hypothetical protein